MSDSRFYLRSGGRILGPLSMAQIESLQARGRLNSNFEISKNKRTWEPIDSFLNELEEVSPASQSAKSSVESKWYYVDDQRQIGPLSLSELQELNRNGRLPPHCLVWKEGLPDWLPIEEVPEVTLSASRTNSTAPQTPPSGSLHRICLRCGTQDSSGGNFCSQCGNRLGQPQHAHRPDQLLPQGDRKDRLVAALLALLLGGLGIHHFYLGNPILGIIYLLFCWTFIPAIVSLIEGIVFLCTSPASFDARYNGCH